MTDRIIKTLFLYIFTSPKLNSGGKSLSKDIQTSLSPVTSSNSFSRTLWAFSGLLRDVVPTACSLVQRSHHCRVIWSLYWSACQFHVFFLPKSWTRLRVTWTSPLKAGPLQHTHIFSCASFLFIFNVILPQLGEQKIKTVWNRWLLNLFYARSDKKKLTSLWKQ